MTQRKARHLALASSAGPWLRGALAFACLASLALVGCSDGFGVVRPSSSLSVTVQDGNTGSPDKRIAISFSEPAHLTVHLEAHRPDGSIDDTFNGYVRVTVKPGTVVGLQGPGTSGRNVLLKNGVADKIGVDLVGSYGDSYLWLEDLGYVPANPTRKPPPQCSDGIDNDGDGAIDFPADHGCAFANDDSEEDGTYVAGVSPTIYFVLPRIADVRGVAQGGAATPFPHAQVAVDTGYDLVKNEFSHSVVVTRIAQDGFYVTDVDDPRGYSSVFAFTFSAPPHMGVCDRLTSLTGTAADFFGFTELGFPTWAIEHWVPDPKQPARGCRVPEPFVFTPTGLADSGTRLKYESAMVRLYSGDVQLDPKTTIHTQVHVGGHFGPDIPKDLVPTDTASNCDINHDSKVDFTAGTDEATCATNCTNDVECTEYSNYAGRSAFRVVVTDDKGSPPATIQVDASTSSVIDPLKLRGQPIKAFTGTLRYFSGGSQFTIEARCPDDIVLDAKKEPLTSDQACVIVTGAQTGLGN